MHRRTGTVRRTTMFLLVADEPAQVHQTTTIGTGKQQTACTAQTKSHGERWELTAATALVTDIIASSSKSVPQPFRRNDIPGLAKPICY